MLYVIFGEKSTLPTMVMDMQEMPCPAFIFEDKLYLEMKKAVFLTQSQYEKYRIEAPAVCLKKMTVEIVSGSPCCVEIRQTELARYDALTLACPDRLKASTDYKILQALEEGSNLSVIWASNILARNF